MFNILYGKIYENKCLYVFIYYYVILREILMKIYKYLYILSYYVFHLDEINEHREYMHIYSENKIMKYA